MSVALWVNEGSRGAQRARNIKNYGGGTFGFVSMPLTTTSPTDAATCRAAGLRVNLHMDATGVAERDALWLSTAIDQLAPIGLVEINNELPDASIGPYTVAVVREFRARRATWPLRIAVAPNKHGFLPGSLFAGDPNLHASMFTYYGNMQGRYSEATALKQLLDIGVPKQRAAVIYAAACDVFDPQTGKWHRCLTLPSVFLSETGTNRALVVGPLGGGPVFSDDLLADMGQI